MPPLASFAVTCRTASAFLRNPVKLWRSGGIDGQRAVLRLAFAGRLQYARETGCRTAEFSIPFKMLGGRKMIRSGVVEPGGIEPPTS
jgi:site-specific DNA recombinase